MSPSWVNDTCEAAPDRGENYGARSRARYLLLGPLSVESSVIYPQRRPLRDGGGGRR